MSASTTNYGLVVGALSGAGSNMAINTSAITTGSSTTNAINIGAITGGVGVSNAINIASMSGGAGNMNGIQIAGLSGTAQNMAIYIGPVSGGTGNYAIYTSAGAIHFGDTVTLADAKNLVVGTTTGTQIGTASTQKLGFFGATPVVQQTGNVLTALSNLGLVTSPSISGSQGYQGNQGYQGVGSGSQGSQGYQGLQGLQGASGGGGGDTTATYVIQTADSNLTNAQVLSSLATGVVKVTTGTGALSVGSQGVDYLSPISTLPAANVAGYISVTNTSAAVTGNAVVVK